MAVCAHRVAEARTRGGLASGVAKVAMFVIQLRRRLGTKGLNPPKDLADVWAGLES